MVVRNWSITHQQPPGTNLFLIFKHQLILKYAISLWFHTHGKCKFWILLYTSTLCSKKSPELRFLTIPPTNAEISIMFPEIYFGFSIKTCEVLLVVYKSENDGMYMRTQS